MFSDYRGVSMVRDAERTLQVCKDIISSSDAEFSSRSYILGAIQRVGINYQDWSLLGSFSHWKNASQFGIMQYPTEFADFVLHLSRLGLQNGIEIGSWRGATGYFIASVLQRANHNFQYNFVDIEDNLVLFDKFSSFLRIEKHCPKQSNDFIGEKFDFVFIDADHSYNGAMSDYVNLGKTANKCLAFHDIHGHEYDHLDGGIVRAWNEIKLSEAGQCTVIEFAHSPVRWMGIGLIIR
jgi:hypothetical protein